MSLVVIFGERVKWEKKAYQKYCRISRVRAEGSQYVSRAEKTKPLTWTLSRIGYLQKYMYTPGWKLGKMKLYYFLRACISLKDVHLFIYDDIPLVLFLLWHLLGKKHRYCPFPSLTEQKRATVTFLNNDIYYFCSINVYCHYI